MHLHFLYQYFRLIKLWVGGWCERACVGGEYLFVPRVKPQVGCQSATVYTRRVRGLCIGFALQPRFAGSRTAKRHIYSGKSQRRSRSRSRDYGAANNSLGVGWPHCSVASGFNWNRGSAEAKKRMSFHEARNYEMKPTSAPNGRLSPGRSVGRRVGGLALALSPLVSRGGRGCAGGN